MARSGIHLVPSALDVALGRGERVLLFGSDYETRDGTCLGDFVHVSDLADAHVAALDPLRRGLSGGSYNLGAGVGYAAKEVVDACRRVTGQPIPAAIAPRRPGDPAPLVADIDRAESEPDWRPRISDLDSIVGSAWAWQRKDERRHEGGPASGARARP